MITYVRETNPPEWLGLSTDNKASIKDPMNGSSFFEFNTGDIYFYNADTELWEKLSLG